MKRKKKRNA